MGRGKQIIILLLILIMGVGCIYLGIQIKNKPEPKEEVIQYGSYQQKKISLPVLNESKGEEYLHLMRGMDGSVELFTVLYNEDKTLVRGYKKYVLNSELKWDEADANWMALEFFSDTNYVIRLMAYAETGSLYLVLHNLTAEVPEADEVIRVSTESEVEHVGVKGLYKTQEDGTPIQLTHMLIADNNICIIDELSNCYAYSLVTGELYYIGTTQAPYALASDATNLYTMNSGCYAVNQCPFESIPAGIATTLNTTEASATSVVMAPQEPSLWNRITQFEAKESEYELLDYRLLYSGDTLYLSCQDGIYSLAAEGESWETLMSGMDCIFGRPSVVQQDFIESNDALYSFSKDFTGEYYLTQYFRPLAEEEEDRSNRTVLTISSYRRRAIITEAVVAFQQKNPDIQVVYEVALDQKPDLSAEEYQKQILTKLQFGGAPDILVCDELDYFSYMADGYFENISDLMKPMYTSANLYGNVTNAMAQTKIFVTPAKFQTYFAYGSQNIISRLNELYELAAWCEKKNTKAFSEFSTAQLTDLLCSFYEENFLGTDALDQVLLTDTLNAFQTISAIASGNADLSAVWYTLPVAADSPFDPAITLVDTAASFTDMISVLNGSGASWSTACGRFRPESIVGISSQSSNVKLAKEFIRMLYSDTVQLQDVGIGMPMSKDAIAAWTQYGVSETDITQLTAQLETLDHCYLENSELKAAVYQVLELFLSGELTAEEAAAQIIAYEPAISTYTPYTPETSDFKALFIGDAFMDDAGFVSTFTALARLSYPDITVHSCIHSQESLKEQLKYMEQDNYLTYERIRDADIIVLQEKAGSLTSTVQAVSRAFACCKEDAKVYYLMTDAELDTDIAERLSVFEDLTIIPVGPITEYLTADTMTEITSEHLRSNGDTNALYGYVAALATYHSIFGLLPDGPDAQALTAEATDHLLALVPGSGEASQNAHLDLLATVIERYFEENPIK